MTMQPGYGLLINAAVSACVTLISAFLGVKVIRQKAVGRARVPAISFANIWILFGLIYLFVAGRTTAAYFEMYKLDEILFLVDNFFGVLVAPAIIFFVSYFYLRNKRIATAISAIFGIGCVVWWIFNVRAGAERVAVDFWLSEWEPKGEIVVLVAKYVLYLPTVLAILSLNIMAYKGGKRSTRYKVFLSSLSITGATFLMMVDLLGTSPFVGFAARVGIMVFCIMGYLSYFPTRGVEEWIRKGEA